MLKQFEMSMIGGPARHQTNGKLQDPVTTPPPLRVDTVSRTLTGQLPSHKPAVAPNAFSIRCETAFGSGTYEYSEPEASAAHPRGIGVLEVQQVYTDRTVRPSESSALRLRITDTPLENRRHSSSLSTHQVRR